jgi:hypothetical protein
MDLENITHWLVISGPGGYIGHILKRIDSNWHVTACRMMIPNGKVIREKPHRKCRACIDALPILRKSK